MLILSEVGQTEKDTYDITYRWNLKRWCKRTYELTFAEAYKKYSAKGKVSLRRAQFKLAEKNASMAIFLGKQYLGQRDFPNEPGDGGEVKVIIDV